MDNLLEFDGFIELDDNQMQEIEGGGFWTALGGTLAIAATPVLTVVSPPVGIAVGLAGAGAIASLF